jgi:plastocyanin domain-containing protein
MIIINGIGVTLIMLIIWWFWLYRPKELKETDKERTVMVESGIYSPSRVKIEHGQSITLKFIRKDESLCSEMLLFPDLDISVSLPRGKLTAIEIPALEIGEYQFHCQMQMYRGVLVVT